MSSRRPATVAAPAGDPYDEAIGLTRRLRLPYLRKAMAEVVPTARAQRWDPAELVRILLAEEATGRDEATSAPDAAGPGSPPARPSTAGTRPPRPFPPLPNAHYPHWNG
jgi:hypothetical protein